MRKICRDRCRNIDQLNHGEDRAFELIHDRIVICFDRLIIDRE